MGAAKGVGGWGGENHPKIRGHRPPPPHGRGPPRRAALLCFIG